MDIEKNKLIKIYSGLTGKVLTKEIEKLKLYSVTVLKEKIRYKKAISEHDEGAILSGRLNIQD